MEHIPAKGETMKVESENTFLQTDDDLPIVETDDIEDNQLDEDIKEEDDPSYIKMDWSLETSEERVKKVEEIIAKTPPEKLTSKYLDKLSEYIVYPIEKAERKQGYILTNNRMVTINKRETSYEGLVSKLENGEDGIYNMIINDKNVLLDQKKEITQEDLDTIPGLKELKDEIAKVEAAARNAVGKKKYLLKKQIIEMRQDQYVIKNAFRQPMYCRSLTKTLAKINLDEKITMNDKGEVISTGAINLFNPAHVVALLCNYSGLKMETWDKFGADMRWMLLDLERVVDGALKEKYPIYYKLVIYKIDGKTNLEIQELLEEEFGIKHSVEYISSLWRNKIPKLIADYATNDWLEYHFTQEERGKWKRCTRCGQIKLAHNRFFSKNSTSKDHFYSICKECRNKAAKEKRK